MTCHCRLTQCEVNENGMCGTENTVPCDYVPGQFMPAGEERRVVEPELSSGENAWWDKAFVNVFGWIADKVFKRAVKAGWHEREKHPGEIIALIHSELSEALENYRAGCTPSDHISEFTGVEEEFADVIIRIMDWSQKNNLRIAEAVVAKIKFNETRPYKHGGKKF
jgi:NTP pyrophosphatase (non-canonical NTP hydrolase)